MQNETLTLGVNSLCNSCYLYISIHRWYRILLSVLFLICLGYSALFAQIGVGTTGGEAKGDDGAVSYSVGQVVFSTAIGNTGSVVEGVQLPYEISIISGMIKDAKSISATVFPNPTTDYLILSITEDDFFFQEKWIVNLIDANGRILRQKEIEAAETKIDLAKLPASTYILNIVPSKYEFPHQEKISYKIVKN